VTEHVINIDVFFECDEGDDPKATAEYIIEAIRNAGASDIHAGEIEET